MIDMLNKKWLIFSEDSRGEWTCFQKECIPVGCVPASALTVFPYCLYLGGGVGVGGVGWFSVPGGMVLCVCGGGGRDAFLSPRGCGPLSWEVWHLPSSHPHPGHTPPSWSHPMVTPHGHTPPLWTEWKTRVKTLYPPLCYAMAVGNKWSLVIFVSFLWIICQRNWRQQTVDSRQLIHDKFLSLCLFV